LMWPLWAAGGAASSVPIDIDFSRLLWCLWVCVRIPVIVIGHSSRR
jgi:hypothetical protein